MRPYAPRTAALGPNAGIEGIGGELPGGGLVLTNRAGAPGTVCAGGCARCSVSRVRCFGSSPQAEAGR